MSCTSIKQAASSVQASAFSQYKGELVISLKYVTTKNLTTRKIKGNTAVRKVHLAPAVLYKLCLKFLKAFCLHLLFRQKGDD